MTAKAKHTKVREVVALNPPGPARQVQFYQLLLGARKRWFMDALTDALGQLEQTVVKEQIGKCVPPGAQKALAAAGLRDEFLFPVPAVLEAKPSLVGYYRLLLGVPQKSFYGSAQESEKLVDLLDSRVAVWRYARRDERQ